eukprot:Platyproteum_vivax@DN7538_c0_g1_i5.p1
MECEGLAAQSKTGDLAKWKFQRRECGPKDVYIKIHYCGVCHSDIHVCRAEWNRDVVFPIVPGHEIAGIVEKVGAKVTKHKVGDRVGVGCFVDSCKDCHSCKENMESYCSGKVMTYNAKGKDGLPAYGGYSKAITVDEDFVLKIDKRLPLDAASPLLCAGITVWSPMKFYGADKKGLKIAVAGLGGLGHMAVKFGVAFGCEVTVLSRTPGKEAEAKKGLGAHNFVLTTKPEEVAKVANTFDFIIDTIAANHDTDALLGLVRKNGGMVIMVGIGTKPLEISQGNLIFSRKRITGSLIGGMKETQEMLDFCAEHKIVCDIETIPVSKVNEAWDRTVKSDVKYRFVLDIIGSM